jgi:uncharacterized protein YndB with AHSA1/START domain
VSSIRTDTFLPYPPERVWQALTDSEQLASWLMPNDFRLEVGHQFTFRTDPAPSGGFDGIVHCQVLELEPPRLLRLSWVGGPGLDTIVTWQLVAEGRGTRLLLSHDGFDDKDPGQQAVQRILGGGWRGQILPRLKQVLAT